MCSVDLASFRPQPRPSRLQFGNLSRETRKRVLMTSVRSERAAEQTTPHARSCRVLTEQAFCRFGGDEARRRQYRARSVASQARHTPSRSEAQRDENRLHTCGSARTSASQCLQVVCREAVALSRSAGGTPRVRTRFTTALPPRRFRTLLGQFLGCWRQRSNIYACNNLLTPEINDESPALCVFSA
jgi:hypothetical protein